MKYLNTLNKGIFDSNIQNIRIPSIIPKNKNILGLYITILLMYNKYHTNIQYENMKSGRIIYSICMYIPIHIYYIQK
jgi:hypothetical protein